MQVEDSLPRRRTIELLDLDAIRPQSSLDRFRNHLDGLHEQPQSFMREVEEVSRLDTFWNWTEPLK